MSSNQILAFLITLNVSTASIAADAKRSPTPATYRQQRGNFESEVVYWRSFDTFINNRKQKLKFAKGSLLARISKDLEAVDAQEKNHAIAALQNAADEYRKTLNIAGQSDATDQALLSLAQTLFTLATLNAASERTVLLKESQG